MALAWCHLGNGYIHRCIHLRGHRRTARRYEKTDPNELLVNHRKSAEDITEERRKVRKRVVSLQSLMSQMASFGNEDLNKEYLTLWKSVGRCGKE
jgi:hypothetical protein